MSIATFHKGVTVQIEGEMCTLLRQLEDGSWLIEAIRTGRITNYTADGLLRLYASGKLEFVSGQHVRGKARKIPNLTAEQWEVAKLRRAYVMAILDMPSSRDKVASVIQQVWEHIRRPENGPPHVATVLRWKAKFVAAHRSIVALVDQHDRKGNRRPRFDTDTVELVKQAIDRKYLVRERGTVQDTLDYALMLVHRENDLRLPEMQLKLPTERLVRRLISEVPAYDRHAARYGRDAAISKFRSALHKRRNDEPLERVETDHTLLDMIVIDDVRMLPLGRPTFTACIDSYTRMILGVHISFEPPSYLSIAHCLRHAILPKADLRQQYPSIKHEWLAHGCMRELVVDNGREFHSESLENACYALGIEIHYAPRKQGWFKGKIERFNGTISRGLLHKLPGTTFHNILARGDYDPVKHAVIRYSAAKEMIFKWVCDIYHQTPHKALDQMTPEMMWKSSVSAGDIVLPKDPNFLGAILGRSATRCLTHTGVQNDHLFYNSPELQDVRRRIGDNIAVELRILDDDIGSIYVVVPKTGELLKVPSTDQAYAAGLSRYQHRVVRRYAERSGRHKHSRGLLEAKAELAEMIEAEMTRFKGTTRKRVARFLGEVELVRPGSEADRADTEMVSGDTVELDVRENFEHQLPVTLACGADVENEGSSGKERRRRRSFKVEYRERIPVPPDIPSAEE